MGGYRFVFAKSIAKNVSRKYSKKLIDHAKNAATDAIKLHQKSRIPKTAEATDDFISDKITNKITKNPPQKIQAFSHKQKKNHYKYQEKDIYLPKNDIKLLIV